MSRIAARVARNLTRSRLLVAFLAVVLLAAALIATLPSKAQRSWLRSPREARPVAISPSSSEEDAKEELEKRLGALPQFGVDEFDGRDSPPDLTPYNRPVIKADHIKQPSFADGLSATVVDTVISNTDPNLQNTEFFGDTETNIAINPANVNEIVITAFSASWGANSAWWHSTDGGATWTKRFTIPVPPGAAGSSGCPCDQSIDYGRNNLLSAAFLTAGAGTTNIYSGTSSDPTATAAYSWLLTSGNANRANSSGPGNTDQPWLIVNHDPTLAGQDNTYVAYDDFSISPRGMHVAVSKGENPLNFIGTNDKLVGNGPIGFINPGLRMAADPTSGKVYALFQQYVTDASDSDVSRNINYMLNRSTDGGQTWTLNASGTGVLIANARSTQPTSKFGTVNALLGGVDAAAVDSATGDVYYVYGTRDGATGNNRLAIRRLTDNGAGGLTIGSENFVTGQVQAAIPSIAVNSNGVVGVFYYTFDGIVSGFPQFTAHLATSTNHGQTFSTDTVLETFLSSATDNGDTRQRVLGDYHQVKAVGATFYGSFTGNGVPFGRATSNHDPIFYKMTVLGSTAAGVTVSGRVLTASGAGLRNALVWLTDDSGKARRAITGAFGYYSFDEVASGRSYVVGVTAKRYTFRSQLITVYDTLSDMTFVADQ